MPRSAARRSGVLHDGCRGAWSRRVDLVVPVKTLERAKSRLRGAVPARRARRAGARAAAGHGHRGGRGRRRAAGAGGLRGRPDPGRAARHRGRVRRRARPARAERGAVLRRGAAARAGAGAVGALQADLPALRPADLAAAIAATHGRRAYCADRPGTGTTLLLAAPGEPLTRGSGRVPPPRTRRAARVRSASSLASLRCDVDTEEDLAVAADLGLGTHSDHPVARGDGKVHPSVRPWAAPLGRNCWTMRL